MRPRMLVALFAILPFAFPFVWLIASALKPVAQFYASPPTFLPNPPSLANIQGVLSLVDVPRLTLNSLVVGVPSVVGTVFSSAVAGYAFATLPARGRDRLFAILIVTMLVPVSAIIVPQFILFSRLGWVGSYLPLIVPHVFASPFFVFLFRQWFKNLPAHIFESAEIEGASPWQAFRLLALPLAKPAVAAVGVFAFIGSWNDFLGPLVYLRSPDTFTLSLGLASFQGVYVNELHYSLTLALLALVPPLALFALAQRYLVGGVAATGWRA